MTVLLLAITSLLFFSIGIIEESIAQSSNSQDNELVKINMTHSVALPPPWILDWQILRNDYYQNLSVYNEVEIIKKFYEKFGITIVNATRSSENAQACEAIGCISGTYHLFVSQDDAEKIKNLDFGFVKFADYGIIESTVNGDVTSVARWQAKKIFLSTDGEFELDLDLFYESPDPTYYSSYGGSAVNVDKMKFVDSMIVLVYPYGAGSFDNIPIDADSFSSKEANVKYSGSLNLPQHDPLYGDRITFGLGWIRIFEDENDQRYYQWMRSRSENLLYMNEVQKANGTFFVNSPFPEFAHKVRDSSLRGFEYVEWIKENVLYSKKSETPLKQIAEGILPENVVCKEGLQLIFKSKDNSPACVKPQTAEKLVERGWGTKDNPVNSSDTSSTNLGSAIENPYLSLSTDKPEYIVGEPVMVTLTNIGNVTISFGNARYGLSIQPSKPDTRITLPVEAALFANQSVSRTFSGLEGGEYTIKTQFFVANNVYTLSKNVTVRNSATLEPVSEKTWVEIDPVTCVNYIKLQGCYIDWLTSYYNITKIQPMFIPDYPQLSLEKNSEYIKDYFGKQGTDILDVRYAIVRQEYCEFGECWDQYKLELLVSNSDTDKMLASGFKISENQNP